MSKSLPFAGQLQFQGFKFFAKDFSKDSLVPLIVPISSQKRIQLQINFDRKNGFQCVQREPGGDGQLFKFLKNFIHFVSPKLLVCSSVPDKRYLP